MKAKPVPSTVHRVRLLPEEQQAVREAAAAENNSIAGWLGKAARDRLEREARLSDIRTTEDKTPLRLRKAMS